MDNFFITLAALFLLGAGAYWLGLKTSLPSVTMLITLGIVTGPSGFDLFSGYQETWFPVVSSIALVMLGFLMGNSLTVPELRQHGTKIFSLSIGIALCTFAVVFCGLILIQQPLELAILFAGIATATDPAATTSVIFEEKRQHTSLGRTLTGIVALDDAWGLLIFSFCMVIAAGTTASDGLSVVLEGLWEIGGAIVVGVAVGLPMAFLTGRIRTGEPTLVEALGLVFLCAGFAFKFQVSELLAAITMGAVVANLAKHHDRPFRAIEGIEWPFLVMFFILAGASLEVTSLVVASVLTTSFILLRIIGKLLGGGVTNGLMKQSMPEGAWIGFAMLPQAGVAVALALTASQSLPHYADILLTVTLASTVIFELIGPVTTRIALRYNP